MYTILMFYHLWIAEWLPQSYQPAIAQHTHQCWRAGKARLYSRTVHCCASVVSLTFSPLLMPTTKHTMHAHVACSTLFKDLLYIYTYEYEKMMIYIDIYIWCKRWILYLHFRFITILFVQRILFDTILIFSIVKLIMRLDVVRRNV